MAKKILLVEDDEDIAALLRLNLLDEGYQIVHVADGAQALRLLEKELWDAVILDLMLPGVDGLEICRRIRQQTRYLPVIIISARASETQRVQGLEMGADDYLAKPFNPRELLARIKAVLRRANLMPEVQDDLPGKLYFDHWQLDMSRRELIDEQGVSISLSTAEFDLLKVFLERPKRVLSRDQLLDLARGREAQAFDRAIDTLVSRLRRKLELDPKKPELIKTVWGGGYMFSAEVRHDN